MNAWALSDSPAEHLTPKPAHVVCECVCVCQDRVMIYYLASKYCRPVSNQHLTVCSFQKLLFNHFMSYIVFIVCQFEWMDERAL